MMVSAPLGLLLFGGGLRMAGLAAWWWLAAQHTIRSQDQDLVDRLAEWGSKAGSLRLTLGYISQGYFDERLFHRLPHWAQQRKGGMSWTRFRHICGVAAAEAGRLAGDPDER